MAALSHHRAGIVRALIEGAPDATVQGLDAALKTADDGALSSVKAIVSAEMQDRAVRDAVFEPLLALFTPRTDGFVQLQFPRAALGRTWRALKVLHPAQAAAAAEVPLRRRDEERIPPIFDD